MAEPTTEFVALNERGGGRIAATAASIVASHQLNHQLNELTLDLTQSEQEKVMRERRDLKRLTWAIAIGCIACMITGLVAMFIEKSGIVILAFLFPLVTAPWTIHQRRMLNKLPTLCYVINEIRAQANRLTVENNKLHTENNRLTNEVCRLNEAETQLQDLARASGSDVEKICDLVKENGEIQQQMKRMQKTQQLQNLLTTILNADRNNDAMISDSELERLLIRMSCFSVADTTKLREVFHRASVSQKFSATALYKMTAAETFADDEEFDPTFSWLFQED